MPLGEEEQGEVSWRLGGEERLGSMVILCEEWVSVLELLRMDLFWNTCASNVRSLRDREYEANEENKRSDRKNMKEDRKELE